MIDDRIGDLEERELGGAEGCGVSVGETGTAHRPRFLLLARVPAVRVAALVAGLLLVGVLAWRQFGEQRWARLVLESPTSGRCEQRLGRQVIDQAVELGTRFMLAHQRPAGNFTYEYDWRRRAFTKADQQVRQAGALWGLALLYQDQLAPKLAVPPAGAPSMSNGS